MANFGQLVLTNLGVQAQYEALAGKPLRFKRIGMGSGRYSGNIAALTSLVKENVSVQIRNGYMQGGSFTIEGFFANDALNTGFEWREIGVFVEDQSGNEILYCYANAGDSYDYIPATEDERYSKYIRVAIAVGNATNIEIVQSKGILYVDTATFNTLKDEVDILYPTKEKSGSFLTLDNSANALLASLKLFGKTAQVSTTGAQLWENKEIDDVNGQTKNGVTIKFKDGVYTLNGTCTDSIIFFAGSIALDGGEYTLAANNPINNGTNTALVQVYSPTNLKSMACMDNANNKVSTAALPESGDYELRIRIEKGVTYRNFTLKPMLNKGNAAITWEHFSGGEPSPSEAYPQDLWGIGLRSSGDGEAIKIGLHGKNFFKVAMGTANGVTLWKTADSYVLSGTCTGSYNFITPIEARLPAGNYTLSANNPKNNGIDLNLIDVHHDDGETLSVRDISNYGVATARLRGGDGYMCRIRIENGITYDNYIINPQLEYGDFRTDYEEAKEPQSIVFDAPIQLNGFPVQRGGNYTDKNGQQWICDELDFERGVLVSRVGNWALDAYSWTLVDLGDVAWWQTNLPVSAQGVSSNTEYGLAMAEKYRLRKASGMSSSVIGEFAIDIDSIKVNNGSKTEPPSGKIVFVLKYPSELDISYMATSEDVIAKYKALRTNNPTSVMFYEAGTGVAGTSPDAEMSAEYITRTHESLLRVMKRLCEEGN